MLRVSQSFRHWTNPRIMREMGIHPDLVRFASCDLGVPLFRVERKAAINQIFRQE